ncbi:TetR/AcrR family transcriptional regulator [Tissierella praeacuta]|uniref:Transcriptional regulator, TetR family n=2 Tax=Tissierella praeacuta TaxID=43131 RepID=A0A1M4TAQ1_9FIRM|nr:TetR/AcrR family transcriptional regulator [Tissierella praeacuta]TCU68156.1 TetR family transcriptional regulator [Tissierella praeacuta]SHE41448.1 transcriptional regulator, TetR family [Tissierella praeacuta DSM 18095]SUP04803.1 HTH-type transcriptional repressor KstR2 [Tissierella praeacuta]
MSYEMERSVRRKQELINIIVNLMDEEGLKNVTVKDICEAANISIGAFYHYFQSKDAIVDEMFILMDEFFLVNQQSILEHPTAAEQIIDFVNHFGIYVEEWGYYANLLIMRSHMTKSDYNRQRRLYGILEEIIIEGINNGEFKVKIDPKELITMIFVIIRGYLLEWINREHSYPVRGNMVKEVTYLINFLTT